MLPNANILKYHKAQLLCVLLSIILYSTFAYNLVRTEATKFILLYVALFIVAFSLKKTAGFNFSFLVITSVLIRLVFFPAIPNLSQDFYRFIWDGRMLFNGFNPYLYTPESFISNGQTPITQTLELYNGMGKLSAAHYTNYPPLNQLCFYIAALFSSKSIIGAVITMRILIIAADIGILYFGKKLLEHLHLPSSRIWWYVLNPFIIIELTGNLHFEGVMLFFLIWSLYLLSKNKWISAAIIFACSISVKLMPLLFLPLFFWWFSSKKFNLKTLVCFYSIVILTTVSLFIPFFSFEFISNYSKTVGLWFNNFEFNASIYYIARKIGYAITGYNEIKTIGRILPVLSVCCILYFSFFKKNNSITTLTTSIVIVFTVYLFLSTTVHPWYIATLVLLCVFTNYRFPLIWSFVICLSYLSYLGINTADKSENLWVIGLEYSLVYTAFFWEVVFRKQIKL